MNDVLKDVFGTVMATQLLLFQDMLRHVSQSVIQMQDKIHLLKNVLPPAGGGDNSLIFFRARNDCPTPVPAPGWHEKLLVFV